MAELMSITLLPLLPLEPFFYFYFLTQFSLCFFSGVSKESFEDFVQYATQFLGNMSNYRSFGDRKFIPRVSAQDIQRIVEASAHPQKALALWESTKEEIFSIEPSAKTLLGFPEDGHVSGYYSSNITKADIKLVQDYCEKISLDPLNTR